MEAAEAIGGGSAVAELPEDDAWFARYLCVAGEGIGSLEREAFEGGFEGCEWIW